MKEHPNKTGSASERTDGKGRWKMGSFNQVKTTDLRMDQAETQCMPFLVEATWLLKLSAGLSLDLLVKSEFPTHCWHLLPPEYVL